MACIISCSVAIMFIVASIYITFMVDKYSVTAPLIESLPPHLKVKYASVVEERKTIHRNGFILGLGLSLLAILVKYQTGAKINALMMACLSGSITLATTYFYYILSEKKHKLVEYLDSPQQRRLWSEVYREMQYNYHVGLLLGIFGASLLPRGLLA